MKTTALLVCVFLLIAANFLFNPENNLHLSYVKIPVKSDTQNQSRVINGILYFPYSSSSDVYLNTKTKHSSKNEAQQAPRKQYPAIILTSGVITRQARMFQLAKTLSHAGFVVLTYDSSPWLTELERISELKVVIDWIKKRREIDPERIGLLGHSMGANIAFGASLGDTNIKALVSLGMAIFPEPTLPLNLLQGIGLYDQAHSPYEMRQALIESVKGELSSHKNHHDINDIQNTKDIKDHLDIKDNDIINNNLHMQEVTLQEGKIYGDFKTKTARGLVISPISSHATELTDPIIIKATVNWFIKALSHNESFTRITNDLLLLDSGSQEQEKWINWIFAPFRFILCTGLILFFHLKYPKRHIMIIIGTSLIGILSFIQHNLSLHPILISLILGTIFGTAWNNKTSIKQDIMRGITFLIAAVSAYQASQLVSHLIFFIEDWRFLVWSPVFIFLEPFQFWHLALDAAGAEFQGWQFLFIFMGFMTIEAIYPGKITTTMIKIFKALVIPFKTFIFPCKISSTKKINISNRNISDKYKEVIALFILTVITAIFWKHILAQYHVDMDLLWKISRFIVTSILFPIFILHWFARIPIIKKFLVCD